jgi:hypothetical protein
MDNYNQEPTGRTEPNDIKKKCDLCRGSIKMMGITVKDLMEDPHFKADNPTNSEMKANIMLAYRHLEDARMRLGKVIQAYDGGVSCYDKAFENQERYHLAKKGIGPDEPIDDDRERTIDSDQSP